METATTTTAPEIIHQTSTFLKEALSQPELRHRITSTLRRKTAASSLKPLTLASETLENAIAASTRPTVQSSFSSLGVAEKLLASSTGTPLSCFTLSLIYAFTNQPARAAASLLHLFDVDPALARSEIAPSLFESLFLVHLLPVLQCFNDQRGRILLRNGDEEEFSVGDVSVCLPPGKVLSKMSSGQAVEIRLLEGSYEEVLDENCRLLVGYFKEVLAKGGKAAPFLVAGGVRKSGAGGVIGDAKKVQMVGQPGFENGRYNPMWDEGERSVEFGGSSNFKLPSPSYPQRVSPEAFRISSQTSTSSANLYSEVGEAEEEEEAESSSSEDNSDRSVSSSESETEAEVKDRKMALFEPRQGQVRKQKQPLVADSSCSPDHLMADVDTPHPGGGKHTPPKDFVCLITSQLFDDPVTLETGQTYERKAIQEWLDRGNSTCPITRQKLHSTQLPKTNYVLKRLIASWQERNPSSVVNQPETPPWKSEQSSKSNLMPPSASPNSVISQATFDGTMSELRLAINNLCMSEILNESEMAVLRIERFWQEADLQIDILSMLTKPPVINGFVEMLFNSVDPMVLNATVFLLSELGSRDKGVIQTLTRVDSDVECIVALFKKGLLEAVVLIYLLRPSTTSLLEMDMVETLIAVIKKKDEDMIKMCLQPKTTAVLLLGQILGTSEESIVSSMSNAIVSTKVIENIVGSLGAELADERIAAVGILLRCMLEDGKCRNSIADKAELAPVLEIFVTASDGERFEIIHFLYELVKLNRRTFNEQILHIIKDEGAFSTMHTLLNYLQTAQQEQSPVVAGLLLQLDLLDEPRKMSIYREDAIDTLISCLRNSELPGAQISAAETIVSLQGRFTASGNSLTRAFLLKRAGLNKSYRNLMRMERNSSLSGEIEETLEQERAAEDWERKMAFALVSHEFGLIFEALAEGLKSRYGELCSACFVAATWLVNMLGVLPDTGIKGAARVCLLKRFVSIFRSARDIEDKVLSLLALSSFISEPEGLRDLASYMKDIKKGLRELKKSSHLAFDILKVLSEGNDSSADLWTHKELVQVDCGENGAVLAITCFKDKIFSGHSDGTIKVWTGRGSILHPIQEIREHSKAVTSLAILHAGEKLYSGSTDKTARVWAIGNESLHCVQVHDMKDHVHNLIVANSIACFIPQGAGVKVHSWNGGSKLLNANKNVKCMSLVQGKLYCGCHDSSIQEIDLASGTLIAIQSGSRKLMVKSNPVQALQVYKGLVYSASSPMDGAAVKIWNASNYEMVGSLNTSLEVRAMAVSSELIYLGSKNGLVEIWDRKKLNTVDTLQTGTNSKILCMALDANEEVLVIGTADGRIQAWGLS